MCIVLNQKGFHCFFLFAAECICTCHLMYSFFLAVSFSSLVFQRFFGYEKSNYNFFNNSFKLCTLLTLLGMRSVEKLKKKIPSESVKKHWSSATHFVVTCELMAALSQKMYPATLRNEWGKAIGIYFQCRRHEGRAHWFVVWKSEWNTCCAEFWLQAKVSLYELVTGATLIQTKHIFLYYLLREYIELFTLHVWQQTKKGAGLKSARN